MDELPPGSALLTGLAPVQRDEARNCSILIHLLLEAGATPSVRTGDFFDKGLAVADWEERLELLDRGQAWVARRLAAALPAIPSPEGRRLLRSMHDSHLANIAACARLGTPGTFASSNGFLRAR